MWFRTFRSLALSLLLALVWQSKAFADVWVFVNEQGIAHFASEQLDNRYELYFSDQSPEKARTSRAPVPLLPSRLLAFFEISPDYKQVKHLLREAAREHRIDYELLQALIAAESGFDAKAISPKGAVGLMQIMPDTARDYGLTDERRKSVAHKLADPRTNIATGSRHLRHLLNKFPHQPELAVAAYNAGLGAVRRAGNQVPPYEETQNYVRTVMSLYAVLKPTAQRSVPKPAPLDARDKAQLAALERGLQSEAVSSVIENY